jgi:hypothetical protein
MTGFFGFLFAYIGMGAMHVWVHSDQWRWETNTEQELAFIRITLFAFCVGYFLQ